MTIREALAALPKHWQVVAPAGELKALLEEAAPAPPAPEEGLAWINTKAAAQQLQTSGRTLRGRARRWARQMEEGRRPLIRVRRDGDADQSPWLFCEEDVARQAAAREEHETDEGTERTLRVWADKVS